MSGYRPRVPLPEAWVQPVADFSTWLRAGGQSEHTLRVRRAYLSILSRSCPDPFAVTIDDLVRVVASPGGQHKPETRRSARAAFRAFYSWAHATGRMPTNPAHLLPAIRIPAGVPKPAPEDVVRAAWERADARGRLMLDLAFLAGLRRAEIAQVRFDDVVSGRLRVCGKGGRTRIVPLHPALAEAIEGYRPGAERYARAVAAEGSPWLFPGRDGGHLTADRVGVILAGLLGPGHSAHALRHAAATRWYRAQRDLFAVQRLLGHSKPETTARYVEVPDDALVAAVFAPTDVRRA